ncbi:vomeronasal type-2 receptor 26-like [Protopterus annectens]|uniref:vomeronasal type-2 receptor 26-like n=1 Tax=Protopterus annectens TaxID=7888 RepID=UPI001CF9605C|nr:vomeronasal type-2 receptor 26-like [Protopterus annectens]
MLDNVKDSDVLQQVQHSVCTDICPTGYRKANRKGQPVCCFDCIRCSKGAISNQTDSADCIKCSDDHWSNESRDKCIPKTIEFLSYTEPLGITLASSAAFCSLITASVLFIFFKYRNTPIIKANNREISFFLLLALVLCFLCPLIFIGRPAKYSCMLRQVAFSVIFTISISSILAKTIMVVIAFKAMTPDSKLKVWVGPTVPKVTVTFCSLIQLVICFVWLGTSPPFPEENMISQEGAITVECNEGSSSTFYSVLGYMGILTCASFIVAFIARKLPDTFNEAKFITFSMLVFASVWLTFIPAYLSVKGKYMVAVEIFAILLSSAGLLCCIFFPKCFIILFKPSVNTREHILSRQT